MDVVGNPGYIVGLEHHRQKELLLRLGKGQLDLFARQGSYQWEEDGVRYVGYYSEARQYRESRRRERKMEEVEGQLSDLQQTAAKGRYYTRNRLWEKVAGLLDAASVRDLWNVSMEPLDDVDGPDEKTRIELQFSRDEMAIRRRKAMEGRYVLATTLSEEEKGVEQLLEDYKRLQRVERGFRHIKSYLKVRPIYHSLWRRIRAQVLVCFLAYRLVWQMEQELREVGIGAEVETVLQRWDQLRLTEMRVEAGEETRTQWSWSLGQVGRQVQEEIQEAGLGGHWPTTERVETAVVYPTRPSYITETHPRGHSTPFKALVAPAIQGDKLAKSLCHAILNRKNHFCPRE